MLSTLLLCANADSGYLGIIAFIVMFLYIALNDLAVLKNYLQALLIMIVTARVLGVLSILFAAHCRPFFTLSYYLTQHEVGDWILIIILICNYGLYYHRHQCRTWKPEPLKKCMTCILLFLCVLGSLYFCYMTFFTKAPASNSLSAYFQFDDDWGTGRGYIWRKCIAAYGKLPMIHKIFGYGLDTTSTLLYNTYFDDSLLVWDAAHNEYLQYLISCGLCMLICYVSILVSSLRKAWKRKENRIVLCCAFAVADYSIQAVVNIAQPVTTPLLFIMLGILESYHRRKGNNDEHKRKTDTQ